MIDFSTVRGVTIPEGVVTQITDESGRVLWVLNTGGNTGSGKIILGVEKITADTYAGETTYTGEQFVLLDIYPKTNGTVSVTYGGLTKTITDTSGVTDPNAQQVFFGTFYGVSDEVETPASGELIIEGDCAGFAIGVYNKPDASSGKSATGYCECITAVQDWEGITTIPDYAFYQCENLTIPPLPIGITNIGDYAFYRCTDIYLEEIPEGVTSIGDYAFEMGVTSGTPMYRGTMVLPSTLQSIGEYAFNYTTQSSGAGCYLDKFIIRATIPPIITPNTAIPIYIIVPKGCGDVYKAADVWSNFPERIEEEE